MMGKTFLTLMSSSLWRNTWGMNYITHVFHVFLMGFVYQNNQVKEDFHGKEIPRALLRPKFRHQTLRGEPRSHFSHCTAQTVKIVCCQRYIELRNPSFLSIIIIWSDLTLGSVIIGSSMFARHSGLKQWEGAVTRSVVVFFIPNIQNFGEFFRCPKKQVEAVHILNTPAGTEKAKEIYWTGGHLFFLNSRTIW